MIFRQQIDNDAQEGEEGRGHHRHDEHGGTPGVQRTLRDLCGVRYRRQRQHLDPGMAGGDAQIRPRGHRGGNTGNAEGKQHPVRQIAHPLRVHRADQQKAEIKGQEHIELVKAFRLFDKDLDGTLSAVELKEGLQRSGETMRLEDLELLVSMADKDHNGSISFQQFCRIMTLK